MARSNLVRLNANGSLDAMFDPDVNNELYSIVVQANGKILIGGRFTMVGGESHGNFARLNADGSLDTSFDPNVFGSVASIATQADGKAVVGGYIQATGGVVRKAIARLNTNGTLDTEFDPNVINNFGNSVIFSIVPQANGKILFGGDFTAVGGVTRYRIARLNADSVIEDNGFCVPIKTSNGGLAIVCL